MKSFLEEAADQNHPLRELTEFLSREKQCEIGKAYEKIRFVGYALDIGYGEITIITSDPFKLAVGGIPRNSLLIMCPSSFESNGAKIPPHFTILRVLDSAPTPLSGEVQQTYFELQKKSMPELDIFTQSELQWGALKTGVLGMFYPHPEKVNHIEFSGDLNNYVSAHKYRIYAPDDPLLNLVCNSIVPVENQFPIGKLRLTECRLPLPGKQLPNVDILLSTNDFLGCRTAMFGKTRLGKSNVVKLIVQSIIETTQKTSNAGQLIFDINGEYANDNPQDGNRSIASVYSKQTVIYALTPKPSTSSKELKLDFYSHPDKSHSIIRTLLKDAGKTSIYIERFLSVTLPSLEEIKTMGQGDKIRGQRKILFYWAILIKAGFGADEKKLAEVFNGFNLGLNASVMNEVFGDDDKKWPKPKSLDELAGMLKEVVEKDRASKLKSSSKKDLFDADDEAIFGFLYPTSSVSAGPGILQQFRAYHSSKAGDFVADIMGLLDQGKVVILDLGNANEVVMKYFSRELSRAVFSHQTAKFTANKLGNHFIQIYFEEAHNLLGNNDDSEDTEIYRRFAKEGAKYHIGMVYSTQSPTTMNSDLLAQTENFFVAHLASVEDVNKLAKLNVAFETMKEDILNAKTPGYIRMLTRSHRFVVSMQAHKFSPLAKK